MYKKKTINIFLLYNYLGDIMKLNKEFYKQDAITVAQQLIGKYLVRKMPNGEIEKIMITETESYYTEKDTACHAHKGRTKRTETIYNEGGCTYVYMCYGIHFLLNVVTGPKDNPEAVLIRGLEGYDGPGKLTKILRIDKTLNNIDLTKSEELWIEDLNTIVKYKKTKRIGIDYATKEYRDKLWRFVITKEL